MKGSLRKLISALLLAVVLYGAFVLWTGWERLGARAMTFQWLAFGEALALASLNYVLRFLKWEFYLARLGVRGIPKLDSFLIFLSGFVLTVTPGKVGEVFKSAVLEETHGVPLPRTAPIVIAERLTDVLGVVALILIGSLGFGGGLIWGMLGAVAVALGLLLIWWRAPADRLFALLEKRGPKAQKVATGLRVSYESLRIVGSPGALALPAILSLVGWGLEGLALDRLLDGLGEPAPLSLSLFFYATATLAGALVPTPGGLGVAETLMQSQLVQLGGATPEGATLAMLLIRFATLWWAVLVGFVALGFLKLRFPGLLGSAQASPPNAGEPG